MMNDIGGGPMCGGIFAVKVERRVPATEVSAEHDVCVPATPTRSAAGGSMSEDLSEKMGRLALVAKGERPPPPPLPGVRLLKALARRSARVAD